jgi:LysR family hydrogen peroxide-inducible transcriptional activator
MIGISFRQLRYFDALARHRHFGRAAAACLISQPALSLQMRELEETLGASLIERGVRSVRLTGLGDEFASRVHMILRSVEELGELARASQKPFAGQLRIGIIPTAAPYLLPDIITRLSGHFPQLDLRPREAITQKLLDELSEGLLDVAIMAIPQAEAQYSATPILTEEFVLVRRRADGRKPVPRPEQLRDMRLLLLEEGHCFRDQALSFCQRAAVPPRDLVEGSTLSTLVQLVAAGIGVTLIPQMAVTLETRSAQVAVSRLPVPRPTRTLGLVWRKSNPLHSQFAGIGKLLAGLRSSI